MLNVHPNVRLLLAVTLVAVLATTSFYLGRATAPTQPSPDTIAQQAAPILATDALTDSPLGPEHLRYARVVQDDLEREAVLIKQAGAGRSPQAIAVPRDGFVFVLHPNGRASVVKSDGIVQPVVHEWAVGHSPFARPMLFKEGGGTRQQFRTFDFSMSGMVFDPDLDVTSRALDLAERNKRDAKKPTP